MKYIFIKNLKFRYQSQNKTKWFSLKIISHVIVIFQISFFLVFNFEELRIKEVRYSGDSSGAHSLLPDELRFLYPYFIIMLAKNLNFFKNDLRLVSAIWRGGHAWIGWHPILANTTDSVLQCLAGYIPAGTVSEAVRQCASSRAFWTSSAPHPKVLQTPCACRCVPKATSHKHALIHRERTGGEHHQCFLGYTLKF